MDNTPSRAGARPAARKRFGQHFLEDVWVQKIIRAIAPAPTDTFLEIGPGRGALTGPLLEAAQRVVAFEIDRDLAGALRQQALPRLTVVEGDFLDASAASVRAAFDAEGSLPPVRVAGNLPYNVASPILFKLIALYAAGLPLFDATVMLQREVADRLLADPGSRDYGVLTILIGYGADVSRVLNLPPGAFRPPPKVHSTVVRLRFRPPTRPAASYPVFTALTQAMFTRRRKTLANALQAYPPLAGAVATDVLHAAGIAPARRPETLSIAELLRLADTTFGRAVIPSHRGDPPVL